MPTGTRPTPTDTSLRVLRGASPRHQPGFDESLERYDALRAEIAATAVPAPNRPRVAGRRRVIGLSAAAAAGALALAGVLVGLTLSAASPQSAYAEARKAIAATSAGAVQSGRLTLTFGLGGEKTLQTTEWNGNDVAVSDVHLSQFAASRLVLIGSDAYLQRADGTWLRYPSGSDLGRLGAIVRVARTLVSGSRADQILALVPGLHRTVQPDGTTVYTGSIPASDSARATPTGDTAAGLATALKSVGNDAQLQLIVGGDGLVRQISENVEHGTRAWTLQYSQLGTTPPISPPDTFTDAAPGSAPAPNQTTTVPSTSSTTP